jgi:hypothetical protein
MHRYDFLRRQRRGRSPVRAVAGLAMVAALLGGSASGTAAGSAVALDPTGSQAVAQDRQREVIAHSRLAATKVSLVALKEGRYVATVRVRAAIRGGGEWVSAGSLRVGQPERWFWQVVTGRYGVCGFAVGEARDRPIRVRLAVSASIGCAETSKVFHIRRGALVRG